MGATESLTPLRNQWYLYSKIFLVLNLFGKYHCINFYIRANLKQRSKSIGHVLTTN